ncbi:DNA glycosylase [Gyrodon lividus]|nr:DNA glycosylase [Gyrodon lividus]
MSASRSEAAPRPVTPVISQWLRSFAYTPEPKARAPISGIPVHQTQPLPRQSATIAPLTVPAKRKRAKSVDDDGVLPVIQKKARKGSRKDTSQTGAHVSFGSAQNPATEARYSAPRSRHSKKSRTAACADHVAAAESHPVRRRSRRTVLDAVEIVRRVGARGYVASLANEGDEETGKIELQAESSPGALSTRPIDYHTPPVSSKRERAEASMHTTVSNSPVELFPKCYRRDGSDITCPALGSSSPRPATLEFASLSPGVEPVLPLKTSKYFARYSTVQTTTVAPSASANNPVSTPSSPILTIPVYIETSDFEYAPLEFSCDGSDAGDAEDATGRGLSPLSWHMYPGLFGDLMIMLGRLKPILIQESIRDDPWKVLIAVRLLNVTTGRAAIPVFCKIIFRWPTPQDLVNAPIDELIELLRPLGLYNKRSKWLRDISKCYIEDPPRYPASSAPAHLPTPNTSPPSQIPATRGKCRQPMASTKARKNRPKYPTTPVSHFPGVGPYALDSFRIFCSSMPGQDAEEDEWKRVMPSDKELVRYLVRLGSLPIVFPVVPMISLLGSHGQRWKWAVEEGKIWYPKGVGVIGDVDVPYLVTLVDELAEHYDAMIGGEGYMYHFSNDLCVSLTS